jgi:small-conductance mechanosensitive channel
MFEVFFWSDVGGERLLRRIRSDIRFRLTELFEANNIQIPFPQRDVHIKHDPRHDARGDPERDPGR